MESASRVRPPACPSRRAGTRPVLLATLDVPFEPAAAAVAVDAAVEAGEPLVVANAVELPPLPMCVRMGYDRLDDLPELATALAGPARLARSLGVPVERLRIRSPRPVQALLQVAGELETGLLVFGPDRSRLGRRRYRKAARAISSRAGCLVWLSADEPGAPAPP